MLDRKLGEGWRSKGKGNARRDKKRKGNSTSRILRPASTFQTVRVHGGPTPLDVARQLQPGQQGYEAAQLVLQAAAPWSRATASLWPAATRAHAHELCWLGFLLSRTAASPGPFCREEQAVEDAWNMEVVPRVVAHHRVEGWAVAAEEAEAAATKRLEAAKVRLEAAKARLEAAEARRAQAEARLEEAKTKVASINASIGASQAEADDDDD